MKRIRIVLTLAASLTPMAALSQTASLTYESTVALVMVDPQTADFECAFDDLPAEITIKEDTHATVIARFPYALLTPEGPQKVIVRRGVDLGEDSGADTSIGFQAAPVEEHTPEQTASPNDWALSLSGKVQLCAGLASLEVVQEQFTVTARFGQYDTRFDTTDVAMSDPVRSYQAEASALKRPYPLEAGAHVQSIGSAKRTEGMPLGLLSFTSYALPVTLTNAGDSSDFDLKARLNIKLILVDPQQK